MSVVKHIIDRLLVDGTPFSDVAGAADFAAIETHRLASPCAYVLVPEDAAGDNERATGRVLQPVETDIAVIIVAENLEDAKMAGAGVDIEALKAFVRSRLLGFVPEQESNPLLYVSGKLLKAARGTIWFELLYSISSHIEEEF